MDFGSLIILGNALVLGVRHGIDWDHIAAIADIVGTANATKVNEDGAISFSNQTTHCVCLGAMRLVMQS